MPLPRLILGPLAEGILSGLSFAAKDLMDVAGTRKSSGNPDWGRTHPPAEHNAVALDRLRALGARLVGKTVTDELAFSLEGENIHYGTPLNPRCPDRLPGGSSSGSASAVASGQVDFALGTDTGGSVRVPSSFCGVFGLRPTHGRVPLTGVTPLAPSFDTLGWMARDGAVLARVGSAFFDEPSSPEPTEFTVVADAFELMDPPAREALTRSLRALLGETAETRVFQGRPETWSETYRIVQGSEAWALHGPWIEEAHPRFAPPIARRFEDASHISVGEVERARRTRSELAAQVSRLLGPGRALVVPSAPTVALPKDPVARGERGMAFRKSALAIGSVAGHGGFPQVSLPIAQFEGRPIGLGIIGSRGSDSALLAFAASPRVRAFTV
jgi:amidase